MNRETLLIRSNKDAGQPARIRRYAVLSHVHLLDTRSHYIVHVRFLVIGHCIGNVYQNMSLRLSLSMHALLIDVMIHSLLVCRCMHHSLM